MAHLSHRTASFNNFSGVSRTNNGTKKNSDQTIKIESTTRNSNVRMRPTSAHSIVRPETPVVHRASESHIHRIRAASTRGDLKRTLQSQPPAVVLSKPPENETPLSDSDDDDVESVKWTSPLDITTYLYKPEYVIRPRPHTSFSSADKDDWNSVPDTVTNASISQSALSLPLPTEDQSGKPEKAESVHNYVTATIQKEQLNGFYKRQITNCTSFIKELNSDIKEIGLGTKRLETQSPRTKSVKEPRQEIVQRGYETLKKMYELNADLTESAAKKNICGPPGNHWMGLTRVEVLEIMRRIRKELDVSPDRYISDTPRMNFTRATSDKRVRKKEAKSKKKSKKSSTKEKKPKNIVKVKAPMVQMQHIPGPKHLHTNVCIRPWEPDLDGWNYTYDDEIRDQVLRIEKGSRQRPTSPVDTDLKANSCKLSNKMTSRTSTSEENEATDYVDEQDYITLEIFNPVFKLFR